jgi:hypothetical protein
MNINKFGRSYNIVNLETLKSTRKHIKTWKIIELAFHYNTSHDQWNISVSNGKRPVSNVNKRAKMFAVCAWTQIAVSQTWGSSVGSIQE